MISTTQEFEEGTAFELLTLEEVYPAVEHDACAYIDFRGGAIRSGSMHTAIASAQDVDQLKNKLAPLLFGAAWKILDLLLELALNRAGLKPRKRNSDRWTIDEKQIHARNAYAATNVLGCSGQVWTTLLRVYAGTVEHRHCLVHRTAKVNASSGALEGVDKDKNPLKPLTREEQIALVQISGLVARGVIGGEMQQRSEEHLKYYLDQLRVHSCSPAFEAARASMPVVLKLDLLQEDGRFMLDMTGILAKARNSFPTIVHFDLAIDLPGGTGRHLFARAEDCPIGKTPINLDDLPPWLEFR